MPKQINTYTFGQALVRKFGLKGRFQPVLDETIVPVTVVDTSAAERLCRGGAIGTSSGAGNQNSWTFENPADSNVLVRLKQFWGVSGAPLTDYFVIALQTAAGAANIATQFRDSQLRGIPKTKLIKGVGGAAVLAAPFYHMDTDSIVWNEEWVISPGYRLVFTQNAQNTTFDMMWDFTETDLTATLGS